MNTIYDALQREELERFDYFTRAQKVTRPDTISNAHTIYKVDDIIYIALDPFDGGMFIIGNVEKAKAVYNSLKIKNSIASVLNIAYFFVNIATLIKILKKKKGAK